MCVISETPIPHFSDQKPQFFSSLLLCSAIESGLNLEFISSRSQTFSLELGLEMTRAWNVIVASGLLVFAAAGLAFPFYMATSRRPVDSSKPLPPQATFRGPYVNTGSCDIGPDHKIYPKK